MWESATEGPLGTKHWKESWAIVTHNWSQEMLSLKGQHWAALYAPTSIGKAGSNRLATKQCLGVNTYALCTQPRCAARVPETARHPALGLSQQNRQRNCATCW